jgi:nitroreductase
MLDLTPDELLTTTRSVRKRLDFDRPVERSVVEECVKLALQAPNGGNVNGWRWLVIDDRGLIEQIADIYNGGLDDYIASFGETGYPGAHVPGADRIASSTQHLRDNFHRCPMLLLPLVAGRTDGSGEAAKVLARLPQIGGRAVDLEPILKSRADTAGERRRMTCSI